LDSRLDEVVTGARILTGSQGGALREQWCIYKVQTLLNLYADASVFSRELFVFFIDLADAFPSVPLYGLEDAATSHGLGGRWASFQRTLQESRTGAITLNGKVGPSFPLGTTGVPQGCPHSPKRFNLFFELFINWQVYKGRGYRCGGHRIPGLAWVDDLVLFARSARELQLIWDDFHLFCNYYGLEINRDKSGISLSPVVAAEGRRQVESLAQTWGVPFLLPHEPYKYLGIWVSTDLALHNHLHHLVDSLNERLKLLGNMDGLPVDLGRNLIESDFFSLVHYYAFCVSLPRELTSAVLKAGGNLLLGYVDGAKKYSKQLVDNPHAFLQPDYLGGLGFVDLHARLFNFRALGLHRCLNGPDVWCADTTRFLAVAIL